MKKVILAVCIFALGSMMVFAQQDFQENYSSPESLFKTHLDAIKHDPFDVLMRAYSDEAKLLFTGETEAEKGETFRNFIQKEFQAIGKDYKNLDLEISNISPASELTKLFGYETVDIFYNNKTIKTQGRLIASRINGEWKVNFPVKEMLKEGEVS